MQSTNINSLTTLVIDTNTVSRTISASGQNTHSLYNTWTNSGREISNQSHHHSVKLESLSMKASYLRSQKLFSRTDTSIFHSVFISFSLTHHHYIHFLSISLFILICFVFPLDQGSIIRMSEYNNVLGWLRELSLYTQLPKSLFFERT